jgi:hypothetical protein
MAYFTAETRDGRETLLPLPQARSGWGTRGQIRGTAASGALARAAEAAVREIDGAALRPARWTVDLFRPAAMAPTTAEATIVRRGRRLCLVDAALLQEGKPVARGSLLLLDPHGTTSGEAWTCAPSGLPPVPDLAPTGADRALYFSEAVGWSTTPGPHRDAARRATWHLPVAVVDGEPVTPFQHVATIADGANLAGSWGSAGVEHINTDLTLALTRLPATAGGIGIVPTSRTVNGGIAMAAVALFDADGVLGTVLISTLANGAHAVDPGTSVF